MRRRITILLSAMALTGCVHVKSRLYNPASGSAVRSVVRVFSDHDSVDPQCEPSGNACLAFLEFDEMGEMWDPAQLDRAIELITRAKRLSPHPIVVTFTHGWKNNANDDPGHVNGNVFGFEGVLDYLEHPPNHRFADSPVVGIYIGWRGNLVPQYWPVRQQLSYFNRENAAIRLPGASLTAALTKIMKETHNGPPGPRVIMVGHSFGGLVMERALTQAMTDYVLRGGQQNGDSQAAWADLVVFVNSAAAASEGKQTLDLLKSMVLTRKLQYSVPPEATRAEAATAPLGARTPQRPLLLSISSLGDIATRFGLVIGHGPSAISRQIQGSWRTYTQPDIASVTSQRSYYLSTLAHMEVLQSHLIVENNEQGRSQCGPLYSLAPLKISTGQEYLICEKPGRWNDTPYWAMQMPATIVPDHSGIFNGNFIALLEKFLPGEQEMRDPALMPRLRLQ
jgi:hypothetical protein